MNKTEIFKQMGWSSELIKHFTIIDDDNELNNLILDEDTKIYESNTTTIEFATQNGGVNINIII